MRFDQKGLFRGEYRIQSTRLKGWDYSSNAYYFVTICTKDRADYFGEIRNGIMGLNELGCVAAKCWQAIPDHFPDAELDAWVIMPNHVHGIVVINKYNNVVRRDAINRVSTYGGITGKHNPMNQNSLGRFIRWFKGRTTFEIRKSITTDFAWQPRFYEHIIRDHKSLTNIRQYILDNPAKWQRDRNNAYSLWI